MAERCWAEDHGGGAVWCGVGVPVLVSVIPWKEMEELETRGVLLKILDYVEQ